MSEKRTTSASYRFPVPSRPKSSEFHQTCVSKKPVASQPTGGANHNKESDFAKCDAVTQDEIWKQSVTKEKSGTKAWEENWGFMTEVDAQGRPKTPKELPEHVTMYSPNVPNTNAGNYGSRLNTDVGRMMQQMEFSFNSERRKKKMGNDLICY